MNLKEYWPGYLRELVEFGAIAQAEQPEFDAAAVAVEDIALEFSAFTLTASGVQRWERILGVEGKSAEDLDARRFRIQSILIHQMPITKRTLYQRLRTLCGEGGFTLAIDYGMYTVEVRVELRARSAIDDVESLVRRSVPANMVASVSLLYNTHEQLARFTHAQLAAKTHYELRNEVLD